MSDLYFSSDEVLGLQDTSNSLMMDSCCLATKTTARNTLGEEIPNSPVWSDEIPCSFDMRPAQSAEKQFGTEHTLLIFDATVRLPVGTLIGARDYVKMTRILGQQVPEVIYEAMTPVQRGQSAIRLPLKRVET